MNIAENVHTVSHHFSLVLWTWWKESKYRHRESNNTEPIGRE